VAVGDFNRDGSADLVVADGYFLSDSMYVLLGNGDGSFQAPRRYTVGTGPVSVTVGDFLGNGVLDVASANGAPYTAFRWEIADPLSACCAHES
jgi:hypothetical protein